MQSGVITAVAIDHLLYDIITRHHCSLITEIYWTGLIFSLLILNRVSNLNAITCTISEICITVIYQFSMENVLHVVGSGGGGGGGELLSSLIHSQWKVDVLHWCISPRQINLLQSTWKHCFCSTFITVLAKLRKVCTNDISRKCTFMVSIFNANW